VTARDRPLGLYIFTNDSAVRDEIIYRTISGGVTVNNCVLHVAQHDMPFGGVGASGMGQYHAYEGFAEFSKMRPVFTSPKQVNVDLFSPPYKRWHSLVFDLLVRFKW
jgi:coniferyl-aldehyde dehydrogenase